MMKKIYKQLLLVPLASFVYALGVSLFLDPNGIAPGGITGVSIVLNRLTGLDTGTLILALNIPLLILAWHMYGIGFVLSSLYSLCCISFFTNALSQLTAATQDSFLASAVGGLLIAVGLGLILRIGSTTGGTDIIVKLLKRKKKHLKTSTLFLIVDICVLVFSFIVFQNMEQLLYAVLTVGIMSVVLEFVLYGKDEAKLCFIITDSAEGLAAYLLENLDIGVTYLSGIGGYTGQRKKIIMCVMKKNIAPFVLDAVKELDPNAFMIVTSANEIYGNGYKSYQGGINL